MSDCPNCAVMREALEALFALVNGEAPGLLEDDHHYELVDKALSSTAGVDLLERFKRAEAERDNWIETARQHLRNEQYYRGLVVAIGEMLGESAKTRDDGSKSEDVLCAKVPELVAGSLERLRKAEEAIIGNAKLLARITQLEADLKLSQVLDADSTEVLQKCVSLVPRATSIGVIEGIKLLLARIAELEGWWQKACDAEDRIVELESDLAEARNVTTPAPPLTKSLLKGPTEPLPEGCYCKPGKCMAPIIGGHQMPCRDPEKAKTIDAAHERIGKAPKNDTL